MRLHRPSLLLAALIALALPASAPASADESHERWRIFVAGHDTGMITAIDLDTPRNRWRSTSTGPAKLYPTATGKAVVAVQPDNDTVAFLHSGIGFGAHGDHSDIAIGETAVIDGRLDDPRPFHVVTHDGVSAIDFDRGGDAAFLTEGQILDGAAGGTEFRQATA